MMIRLSILTVLLPVYLFSHAQVESGDTLFIQRNEKGIIEFARFKTNGSSDRKMQNDIIFLKSVLDAKEGDEFCLKSEETDEQGITHKKFQQYYKGIKVDNAEYLVHGKAGVIEIINGDFQVIHIETVKPAITEQQALRKALEYVGAKKYKWEDAGLEKYIQQNTNNPKATYYPKGELVIAKDNLSGSDSFKLSWQFTISSLEPNNEQHVFVEAAKGVVIRDIPLTMNANTSGTAQTRYSGNQTITCDSYSGGYRLYESRNTSPGSSSIIHTRDCRNYYNLGNIIEFTNTNTIWTSVNWTGFAQHQAALDVHWAVEKTLDYWNTVQLRNSMNNSGLTINSYVHYGDEMDGAWWNRFNNNELSFGDGNGIDLGPWTSLDIVAHEIGHGINKFTANLTHGPFESGALNEGFSDIWGACVKAWAAPNKSRWLFGEDIILNSNYSCIRNMQNPKDSLAWEGIRPDTYDKYPWDSYYQDPHTNSTVLSHWFYLLCEGGSGTNGAGNAYSVNGMGINGAQHIAYNALLYYLNSSANYNAARNATLSAASYLYGLGSNQYISVMNAWHAVGVGNRYPPIITGPIGGLCSGGSAQTYSVTNILPGFTWDKSANLSISGSGNSVLVSATGGASNAEWISVKMGSNELKRISVPVATTAPVFDYIDGPTTIEPGSSTHYYQAYFNGAIPSYFDWEIHGAPSSWYVPFENGYSSLSICILQQAGFQFYVTGYNGCGCDNGYISVDAYYGTKKSIANYPNPVNDILTIEIDQQATKGITNNLSRDVRLFNIHGNMVRQFTTNSSNVQMNVADLPNGIYFLHVYEENGTKHYMNKVVVKH